MNKLTFAQLVAIDQLQLLLDAHYKTTGMPSAILDTNEEVLAAVGRQAICSHINCDLTGSCKRYRDFNTQAAMRASVLTEEYLEFTCKNGLNSAAVPIIIAGQHMATFSTGLFFCDCDSKDMNFIAAQTVEPGFDEKHRREVLNTVPVFTREQVADNMNYFRNLVQILVNMGLKNLELEQELKDRRQIETDLQHSQALLRKIYKAAPDSINDRSRADEALRESGQRLYATIEGSPLPMFVIGTDQKVIYWNKALEQLSGTKAYEVIGTDLAWKTFYDEERPLLANLLSTGDSGLIPHWYADKCSKSRLVDDAYEVTEFFPEWGEGGKWLHFTAAALRDTKGKLTGALETLEDVTERKVAEDKWRSLFNNLPGGSFTVNSNYIIEDVNDVLCTVTGFTREELVGQLCGIICPKGPHLCPIFDMGKDRIDNDETAVKAKDGRHVPIIKSARRIPVGNREVIVENFQDITDRKHLEEQLRHAQKMDAIGQLAGGVAHDFNNILTAIIGYGNLLQMKIGNNDSLGKYVNHIIYSAERAANLTHSLLAFSRKHVINLKAVMVNEIIDRAEKLLSRLVREDIELRVTTGRDCIVRADSVQIEQILMNLVTNARDAMPDGGLLDIHTERVILDEVFVRKHGYGQPGTYVVISVSDTGLGMDEKLRERIFEPFFTTKDTGKGTGLGLSIVYGIIKQHNGYVNVSSEPGNGTTFQIYLPVISGDTEQIELFEIKAPPSGTETVLLAEDDSMVRNLAKSLLEEFGYRVIEAEDGVEAVAKFLQNRDIIQFLILDVMMPRKNGKEAYYEIKRIHPGIKALFMSGYTDDILSSKGILEDNLNFISKPFTQNELLRKIREVLEQRIETDINPSAKQRVSQHS
jgi:two-component system, cell cycle sensor histidine kinase and response regulator CckA